MASRYRRFEQERFILVEQCEDPFDAHDAAHVYRAHENLKCRIVPEQSTGTFLIYVGSVRERADACNLRWCPHHPDAPASKKFFEPRPPS